MLTSEPVTSVDKSKLVLVVEDDSLNQEVIKEFIEILGCSCEVASSGPDAIAIIKQKKFDLVLMDLRMPMMSGLEATKIIRNEMNCNVPIVAVTAHAIESVRKECFAVGMNDFLEKPFSHERLTEVIAKWLNVSL